MRYPNVITFHLFVNKMTINLNTLGSFRIGFEAIYIATKLSKNVLTGGDELNLS